MPLVKQFEEGVSEIDYKPDIKSTVINTPLSPLDYANKQSTELQNEHLSILNEEIGIKTNGKPTQTAGGHLREYKVVNKNVKLNIIKSCCSSEAALKAFNILRNKNIKKRKITILDIKNNRRYRYSLSKNSIKREKL